MFCGGKRAGATLAQGWQEQCGRQLRQDLMRSMLELHERRRALQRTRRLKSLGTTVPSSDVRIN